MSEAEAWLEEIKAILNAALLEELALSAPSDTERGKEEPWTQSTART